MRIDNVKEKIEDIKGINRKRQTIQWQKETEHKDNINHYTETEILNNTNRG